MKLACPTCDKPIPIEQMNIETDVALCHVCDQVFKISHLLSAGQEVGMQVDLHDPPPGVWFHESFDGWTLGATTRSCAAFFLVPFMCVWSGGSLGGIYGSQIARGEFDLVLSLFGIPFLLGTILFGSIALMSVFGKITISVDRWQGKIFTGIGPIGWTRRFDWSQISTIEEDHANYRNSGSTNMVIALVGATVRLKFGSMLSDSRRQFMLSALRNLLAKSKK